MGKPRDLANVVATGNILADGAVAPAELTGVTSTAAEINILDGVTATATELNLLDGVTATTTELNYVDGVTSAIQTQIDTKAPVAGPTFTGTLAAPTINASTALQIGGAAITATAAELNKMDGVTVSASDINSVTSKAPIASPTFTGDVTIPDKIVHDGDTNTAIRFADADTVTVETAGSERMRINSEGNVGIDFTPKAMHANVTSSLNVGSSSQFQRTKDSYRTSNFYYNSSDTGTSIASGYALMYTQDVTNGKHAFTTSTASAGSADATVSLAELMTIDASGNVSVTGTANATALSIGGTAITATAAELNYVDGVTSAIQTQLDAKAPLASPTFSGTVSDADGKVRAIPQSGSDKTSSYTLVVGDVGNFIGIGSGGSITVPNSTFAAGDAVSIFNNTSGDRTITLSITTAYLAGEDADKGSLTLATRGVCTILFISGTVCVVSGNVS